MNGSALVLIAMLLVGADAAAETSGASRTQLVIPSAKSMVLLEVELTCDGQSLDAIGDESLKQLHHFCDRSGDGVLDASEVALLPTPLAWRQILWGSLQPSPASKLSIDLIDTDADQRVSIEELSLFYRSRGLGAAIVGYGTSQRASDLDAAMLRAMDTSGDGKLDDAELAACEAALWKLDVNDDELLASSELVPHWDYPGTQGSLVMLAPRAADAAASAVDDDQLLLLPHDERDTHWAAVLVARRDRNASAKLDLAETGFRAELHKQLDTDGDGELDAAELSAWRALPAEVVWRVDLVTEGVTKVARESMALPDLVIDARVSAGQLAASLGDAEKGIAAAWAKADIDLDGEVSGDEARATPAMETLLSAIDRDGNARLSTAERDAWLKLQQQLAKGLVMLTIVDAGRCLFNELDQNCDGALSRREVRAVRETIDRLKMLDQGELRSQQCGRKMLLVASLGKPVSVLEAREPARPAWHQGMDRNRDGDVSRREFVGPLAKFDELDRDLDGLVSPLEAQQLK